MFLYFQLLLILIISFLLGNFELGWVYSLIFIIFYFFWKNLIYAIFNSPKYRTFNTSVANKS